MTSAREPARAGARIRLVDVGVLMTATLALGAVGVGLVGADAVHSRQPAVATAEVAAAAVRRTSSVTAVTTTSTRATTTSTPTAALSAAEPRPVPPAVTTTCADALAYLAAHQAPGFVDVCAPGSAHGHYGFTCWNAASLCPNGAKVIHIACPAPFVYMNEAHNSWALMGRAAGIDPYGQGSLAEQAFCNRFR